MSGRLFRTVLACGVLIAGCSSADEADTASEASATTEAAAPADSTSPSSTPPPQQSTTTEDTSPQQSTTTLETEDSSPAEEALDEFQSLTGRPWASPDGAHASPEAAAEAFLEFVSQHAEFGPADVVVGEYRPGDQRSGEIEAAFEETFFDESLNAQTTPVITMLVRRSGPEDSWWVVAAATTGLRIDAPAADAVVGPSFELDMTNDIISSALDVRLFAAGDPSPFYVAAGSGGGVFSTGRRIAQIDTTSCDEVYGPDSSSIDFIPSVCDGPAIAGSEGTLLVSTNAGVTTVPVVFTE